jgi:large repetitive protein
MFSGSVATFTAASDGGVPDDSVVTEPTDPVVEPTPTDPVVEPPSTDPISTIANTIGGVVWDDVDRDGVDDGAASEPRLAGVSVAMTALGPDAALGGGDDVSIGTFATDGDGAYLASDLADGTYLIEVMSGIPATYLNTVDPQGPVSPDGRSITAVSGGQVDLNQNFGYGAPEPTVVANGSIGDLVFYDSNANGTLDDEGREGGLSGLTVTLTNVGTGAVVQTTTVPGGTYLFEELASGTYVVAVTAGVPAVMVSVSDPDGGNDATSVVELSEGENDRDQDFGFAFSTVGTSSISGTVYIDRNGDGVRGTDEPVVAGQRVDLVCTGRDREIGTADDVTASMNTDQGGRYVFAGLAIALCKITVVDGIVDVASNTGHPDGRDDSFSLVEVDGVGPATDQDFGYLGDNSVGDVVYFDANANSTDDGSTVDPRVPGAVVNVIWNGVDGTAGTIDDVAFRTTTDAVGSYNVAGLPDGSYTIALDLASVPAGTFPTIDPDGGVADGRSSTDLSNEEFDDTQDFGLGANGMIGDTVWLDLDADGVRDAGEPGLTGSMVTLTGAGFDGFAGTGDDLVATTKVTADGSYLFGNLPAGTYQVAVSGVPSGLAASFDPDGGADAKSSVILTAGQKNLDQDFGFVGSSGVGDTVFVDTNGNNVRDAGEVGVANIKLTVSSPGVDQVQGTVDDLMVMTVTDANGNYLVTGLPSGSTVVSYDPNALPGNLDPRSDADGGAANVTTVNLISGATNTTVDFAVGDGSVIPITPVPGGLTGVVFNDPNRNSRQDGNEQGVAGVTVVLVGSTNTEVARTTTDRDGVFSFRDLVPGVYAVVPDSKTLPTGRAIVTETDGTVDGRSAVTVLSGAVARSGDFGIAPPVAVAPTTPTTPATPPRIMPRTGSSGVDRMLEIALAAIITGLGMLAIRRRPSKVAA